MKTGIGLASTSFMLAIIVEDLENFRATGSKLFDFEGLGDCADLQGMYSKWLLQFDDLTSITNEELEMIKLELDEHMKMMCIWNTDEEVMETNIKAFEEYFNGYNGFCKLIVDLYKTNFKEDKDWQEIKNSPEFKAKYKELTGRDL
ncbi:hypothetical protein COF68_05690 [Bacillus toyonensis]|uniref:hypothetical protein n=1 Tax=Bacillus toyonensis TaxID=155322 RepID=UPI000BFE9494|nr:hypothetical protein [Bacillus toyonensis]PHE64332.1 hypothetical protein COF68_05690 [Bacillus toyonensis]